VPDSSLSTKRGRDSLVTRTGSQREREEKKGKKGVALEYFFFPVKGKRGQGKGKAMTAK